MLPLGVRSVPVKKSISVLSGGKDKMQLKSLFRKLNLHGRLAEWTIPTQNRRFFHKRYLSKRDMTRLGRENGRGTADFRQSTYLQPCKTALLHADTLRHTERFRISFDPMLQLPQNTQARCQETPLNPANFLTNSCLY